MEFIQFFTTAASAFPQYPRWLYWLAVLICLVGTELLKLPLKHFTKALPDKMRVRINTVVILIPEIFGLAVSGVLTAFGYSYSVMAAMAWGGTSQLAYLFISKIYQRIKGGEQVTLDTLNADFRAAKSEAENNNIDDEPDEDDEDEDEDITADDKFANICDEIKSFKQ